MKYSEFVFNGQVVQRAKVQPTLEAFKAMRPKDIWLKEQITAHLATIITYEIMLRDDFCRGTVTWPAGKPLENGAICRSFALMGKRIGESNTRIGEEGLL